MLLGLTLATVGVALRWRMNCKEEITDLDRFLIVKGNPLLRGDDPYFGAQQLSETTIVEEFGFVPMDASLNNEIIMSKKANVEASHAVEMVGGADGCLVFHENEYEEIQSLFEFTGSHVTDDTKKKSRNMLADVTNIKSNHPIAMFSKKWIDDELEAELGLIGCNTMIPVPAIKRQEIRSAHDLYTPRLVRGSGANREGLCEFCTPGVWLKIKQSAYWYHLNFIHGVSATTGRPYPPPAKMRVELCRNKDLANKEKDVVQQVEGQCATCNRWVVIAHVNADEEVDQQKILNSVWWRHVQKCTARGGSILNEPSKRRGRKYKKQ